MEFLIFPKLIPIQQHPEATRKVHSIHEIPIKINKKNFFQTKKKHKRQKCEKTLNVKKKNAKCLSFQFEHVCGSININIEEIPYENAVEYTFH